GKPVQSGAVPATVSGEPLFTTKRPGNDPQSQETCLRCRPRPAGTSLRRVASSELCAPAAPPWRHVRRQWRNNMNSLLLLLAAASAPADAEQDIVITASRLPIEKAEAP